MAADKSSRRIRAGRRPAIRFEPLDSRVLLATGLGPHLGHFALPGIVPALIRHGHPIGPGAHVNPDFAIVRELQDVFGPGIDHMARLARLHQPASPDALPRRINGQPFVQSVLSNNDTYQILGQQWLGLTLSSQQLAAITQNGTVTLTLPKRDLQLLGDPSVVQVQPGDPAPNGGQFVAGFVVQVPAVDLVLNADNTITITIPVTSIPAGAQLIQSGTANFPNNLVSIYGQTGADIVNAFKSAVPRGAPTSVPTVPGLRLVNVLKQGNVFPQGLLPVYSRYMRVIASQNLLTLDPNQVNLLNKSLNTFLGVVDNWTTVSTAQFAQVIAANPGGKLVPAPPPLAPLNGTMAVSLGVVQQPNIVQANAPERIDVGFVIDQLGNYGIILSARGPLSNTVPTPPPPLSPVVAADLQTEVSNAANLGQLAGWRVLEGITEGVVLEGALSSSSQNGVSTFAASTGYGVGLEYGLAVRYSQVIPMGNIFTGPFA